ncbi:alpha-L-arabinofuranosidase C-terminal domain-containing protein [Nitrospirillum iridis]|uniref:non-reducing end alpha-L-arabinofuranosidase n=1 Tax=Nitrospirillum iridis TaxID=765888 RepID=A0A7X0EC03_9PROT|nr:alpha-L-arabinofuranosidase C-terminal domain-containing protein [Nitrospirillum iridis]MBB6251128.1 alpha-N-arabinofuranosidase [Nitrospirillum iridis]
MAISMKRGLRPWPVRLAGVMSAALLTAGAAHGQAVTARIDLTHPAAAVTPYAYGMFIEPIGGLLNRALWAELLDDRKFYFPVVAEGQDPPQPESVEGKPALVNRKWRPLGDAAAVTMDKTQPYVGTHSVRVALDGIGPHGFGQNGVAVTVGKAYAGHVVARGAAGAAIQVALVWGPGPDQRRTVNLPALGPDWQRLPFTVTAGADTEDARFEITGTGTGAFSVGTVSLMPADNIDGWRADTTALLKTLHSGFWRLPGGNFLSNWDWHGATGPRDRRPPVYDYAWSAMQPNDVGLDEFMTLTRLLDVAPYVTVNAGLGDAHSAAEEVEYLNGPATSAWGAKRAANGHQAPYGVRFWNIGNEPYGWWQIGKTTLDYFVIKHRDFAAAMRAVDPTITLIGSGAMPDQMHPRDAKENASLDSIQPKFGTEDDWTGGLLAKAWGDFDGLSEHWYDRVEKRPDAPPDAELMEFVRSPSNQVRMKAEEWAIYQQRFPAMRDKPIFLSIDEYAYIGAKPTLKMALAYAMVLQEMLRHTDFITMSAFTFGISTLDTTPAASTLNATGQIFKLYGDHFGAGVIPVAVTGNSPRPDPRFPVGYDHPRVKAGSPTYPLDIIAGLAPDRRTLLIAVVNATTKPQPVSIALEGAQLRGDGRVWRLSGATPEAENKVGATPGVTITESRAPAPRGGLTVSPLSTSIYAFPVRNAD